MGGKAPRLELTHFVTGSVMFFVVFHAFRNLYTPPKTPFFPTGPTSLLVGFKGFCLIIFILEHKIRFFVVIPMGFVEKLLIFWCVFSVFLEHI